jgi:hypothetical protein
LSDVLVSLARKKFIYTTTPFVEHLATDALPGFKKRAIMAASMIAERRGT